MSKSKKRKKKIFHHKLIDHVTLFKLSIRLCCYAIISCGTSVKHFFFVVVMPSDHNRLKVSCFPKISIIITLTALIAYFSQYIKSREDKKKNSLTRFSNIEYDDDL